MLRNLALAAKSSFICRRFLGRWVNQRQIEDPSRLVKAESAAANLPKIGDAAQLVRSLYRTAFGRDVDPSGFANCMWQLESGISLETVAAQLVDSAEFQARHGASQTVDIAYITALYRNGLGREPDPEGLARWSGAGANGATRATVLAGFAASEEAMEKAQRAAANLSQIGRAGLLAKSLCRTAFGYAVDPSELENCTRQLESGISLEAVAARVVDSAGFRERHGSNQTVDIPYITALYCDGLRREPDPEGLARWSGAGANGATRATVLAAFAGSEEAMEKAQSAAVNLSKFGNAAQLVKSLYRTAFGRDVDYSGLASCMRQLESGITLEAVAAQFVDSAEFRARHGPSQTVDMQYITALYRDGPGYQPDLKTLIRWLTKGKKGATRAKVLADIAGSDEALEKDRCSKLDGTAAYERWVKLNDTISDADRIVISAHIAGLPLRPLISVILVAGNSSEIPLRKSFDSIVTQLYPDWEVCIDLDTVNESLSASILGDPTTNDPRVKIARTETIECVAATLNRAVDLGTGEFVAFLRAGDLLPEQALYEVALEVGANPDADVIYSDQDQIGDTGQRSNPWFKPGWDPDLLLAHNYVGDLVVYRRTLLKQIGFLRTGFEGAEFHDLALRATAATQPDRIRHIPVILYHRRDEDRETQSENAFPCLRAITASHRAVRDHLDCRGDIDAVLKPAPQIPTAIRVVWPIPAPPPLVSVIVPTRDRADLLAQCVDGVLHRTDYGNLELLIVDNGSIEPSTHALFNRLRSEDCRVRIVNCPGPFNYSALNNVAAREASGEILLLLNNDIDVIDSGWLREMVSHALRPDVGIVGAKLLYPNEQVQHAGMMLGPKGQAVHVFRFANRIDTGYFGQLALARTLSAVTGACVAIRRAVFFEVGGLDEVNLPVSFNDVDLCLRLGDYGYRVVWTPFAELFHLESVSRGLDSEDPAKREQADRDRRHIYATWGSLVESADPFYNPNLLFHSDYQEIPSSPRRRKPWHFMVEQIFELESTFLSMNDASIESNSQ